MEYDEKEKIVASNILTFIKHVCYGDEFIRYRCDQGSVGIMDLIINYIKNEYYIK